MLAEWIEFLAVAVPLAVWAWGYAEGKKRKARAQKRREAGDVMVRRILGR